MSLASINTNTVALQLLGQLNNADGEVEQAQNRVSTGLKVGSAKDDGAIWSIAQTMRARQNDWQVAGDSLARAQSALDVASSATGAINDRLVQLKQLALSYSDTSLDAQSRSAIQTTMNALIRQIDQTTANSAFNGVSLLSSTFHSGELARVADTRYSLPSSVLTPQSFATPMNSGSEQTLPTDAASTTVLNGMVSPGMTTTTSYTLPYSALTPSSFTTPMSSTSSQTFTGTDRSIISGGAAPSIYIPADQYASGTKRIDVALDAFTDPNTFEIHVGGQTVATTTSSVTGQTVLSFDYDPTKATTFQIVPSSSATYAIDNVSSGHATTDPQTAPPTSHTVTTNAMLSAGPLPNTPLNLETAGAAPSNGQATYTIDGGANPGRVDLLFDASLTPDTLDIYQNGVRVAASGQAYASGGGAVPAGQAVPGQSVISFDYDPANGPITLKFNENTADPSAGWTVGGMVLQAPATPRPGAGAIGGPATAQTSWNNNYQSSLDDLTFDPPLDPETGDPAPATGDYTIDAGVNAGRVDLLFDAYSTPDTLEVYQGTTLVAATGQTYASGGAAVGPGQSLPGLQALSFDYDPSNGQSLRFVVNGGQTTTGTAWDIGSLVLSDPSDPLPSASTTGFQYAIPGVVYADRYAFASDPHGGKVVVSARNLTSQGLGLDNLDWSDPASIASAVDGAISTANSASMYFGEQQNLIQNLQSQASTMGGLLQEGVSNLVDADMGAESAKLQAAQSKQQLAVKALAIANAAPQWILSLFR
ncbi:MAG: flagellin [Caulobacteraceae bacterium]